MGTDAKWLIGIGGLVAVLLLTVTVLLLTDPGEGPASTVAVTSTTGASTTSGATTAVTTTVAATSSTVAATTAVSGPVVGAGRCAGTPAPDSLPADAVFLTALPGSFDGAPEPASIMEADQAMVYRSGDTWWVAIGLYPTGILTTPLPEPTNPGFTPIAFAVEDFGALADGFVVHSDVSVLAGAGVYRVYYLAPDCTVRHAVTADEPSLEFLSWFGANHRQGFTCAADGIHLTSAAESSGGLWDVRDRFYRWEPDGPGFVFGYEDGTELPPDDPNTMNAGLVSC